MIEVDCHHFREPQCYSCGVPVCVYCGSDDISRSLPDSLIDWPWMRRLAKWFAIKTDLISHHPGYVFAICHKCDARIAISLEDQP